MEELKILIEIISQNKINRINIIRHERYDGNTQYQTLYQRIRENRFANEAEAANYFFPEHSKKHVYFSNLKNRLKEKLINTVLFIEANQGGFSRYQKAYYSCIRLHSIFKIMVGRSLRKPAIKLAERILKKTQKYEFTEITVSLTRVLKLHYGRTIGDRNKYLHYKKMLTEALEIQKLEIEAEEYLAEVSNFHAKSREGNTEIAKKTIMYAEKLEKITLKRQSTHLMFLHYFTKALALQLTYRYSMAVEVCQQAIDFFQAKKHISSPNAIVNFSLRKLDCYLNLRQFDNAKLETNQYISLVTEGTLNWYIGLQYYLISAFHSRDLDLAYDIVQKALAHKGFKKLYSNQSEEWHIYQGFVRYFVQVGRIKNRESRQRFRLQKFLNEVPVYSRDKRGANIPILIIQILFLLHQKKYGKIIDRVESIEMYVYRYLRRDETFRSNCFIKMLMQLPASSFHRAGVIRRADKYYKQLKASYFDPKASNLEIEIVPYELLWDCVLDSLENRHFRHRTKST